MKRLLLVLDEPRLTNTLKRDLMFHGFEVLVVWDREHAFHCIEQSAPDLVLLGTPLEGNDSTTLCQSIRAAGHTDLPLLLLGASNDRDAIIAGLESGADDYLPRPYALPELLSRLRMHLRHVEERVQRPQPLKVADVILDPASHKVWRAGTLVKLTTREYVLLELLMQHAGRVLTKEVLYERIWGDESEACTESLKVYIHSLRHKLNAGGKANLIRNIRGIGYVLHPSQEAYKER